MTKPPRELERCCRPLRSSEDELVADPVLRGPGSPSGFPEVIDDNGRG